MKPDSTVQRLVAALFSGLLLSLAIPPLPFGFLAWFGFVPLLIALESTRKYGEAFRLGFLTGFVFYLGTIYWLAWNSGANLPLRIVSVIGAVTILSLCFGLMILAYRAVVAAFGRGAHLAFPFFLAAYEWLWHLGELAFPWPLTALTQGNYLPVLQLASVGGTPLIAAWVAAINGILVSGRNRRRTGVVVVLLVGLTFLFGSTRERYIFRLSATPLARVAVVQGNIDAEEKWERGPAYSLDVYFPLTRAVTADMPDLIVWPETAAPVLLQRAWRWRHSFQAFVDSLGVPLITGARHYEMEGDRRVPLNTCFLVRPGARGVMDRYAKVHLVPFGERVPFQWLIPSLGRLNMGQAEFKAGEDLVVWSLPVGDRRLRFVPLICYESIFPGLGRRAVAKGADVLVNLTNDGWYDGTSEHIQHLILSRIRSIETGRCLVRATNTGISAIIGPSGRILRMLPDGVRGGLVAEVTSPVDTSFLRWGWLIPWILLVCALATLIAAVARLRRRRTNGEG